MADSESNFSAAGGDRELREAVGVFHDERTLVDAVDELLVAGLDRSQISLLAGHKAVEETLGHYFKKVSEIEDDPDVPRMAYAGPDSRTEFEAFLGGGLAYVGAVTAAGFVVASGGAVGVAILAAALAGGAGGFAGGFLKRFIDQHHAHYLQDQLDRGGILLWVRLGDASQEDKALSILRSHSADDVHVHDLGHLDIPTTGGVSYDMSFMKLLGL
ncbi:hypothetical protein [Ferruginivarius sediminum]|uniref:hypothetical protein n=1 Tax=Ferruginivarius sediminum TaxID=2661937 RepID=UPI00187B814E|nr:hypothetical protein [Ferruginivarius sediminum]